MVNQEQTEFQNETLKVSVESQPHSRVKLKIVVTPEATEAAYRKAIKNVGKEISVPGFRKGKAPEAVVTTQYAKYIDQEWRDLVVRTGCNDAIHLSKIRPTSESGIEKPRMISCSRDKGAEMEITFERFPEVPVIDPKMLRLKRLLPTTVTPEQVDQAIEDLRRYHAKWETLEPRAVEDEDYVTLTIDLLDPQESRVCSEERFHVKKGELAGWMYDLIIGQSVNVPFEGVSQPDEKMKDGAFTPTRCRFTVNAIQNQVLPPIDDELAKQAGCKDVEELKTNVQKSLEQRSHQQSELHMTRQLIDQLFELLPIEVPKSFVNYEIDALTKSAAEAQESLGISEAEVRAGRAEMQRMISEQADRTTKLGFMLNELMHRPEIEVTKDDLVQELNRQRYLAAPVERIIHGQMPPEEVRQRLLTHLFRKKALAYLLKEATYE